jgi:hypothetical protein
MGTITLVREYIEDGARLLVSLEKKKLQIDIALWHHTGERWALFLSTPLEGDKGPRWVYQRIISTLHSIQPALSFSILEISLMPSDSPLAARLKNESFLLYDKKIVNNTVPIIQPYYRHNEVVYRR